ncbi:DUF1538 domain-containing protein [Bacteroidales bacterium OttesenSCG-928-I21]|nr:DUF1538 domain-containing protein [Bacteroidales bacterium OttesenSCG-928-I21]
MNKQLREKINEAFTSVLPITIIILLLSVLVVPIPTGTILMFIVGALLLVLGMGFFTLGADIAMMPMGEGIGIQLTKSTKLIAIIVICFLMGVVITVAEPDLQVLARQVPAIPTNVLILTVAVGVGVFLVLAIIRILFKIRLSVMLFIFYAIIFLVAAFTPNTFIPVAFDSGGVTTGPITVPFILALGVGLASVRSDKDSQDDSFGLVALCSIGPILTVLILGMLYKPTDTAYSPVEVPEVATTRAVVMQFIYELPHFLKEVFIALSAIVIFFIIFQVATKRYHRHQIAKIIVGFVYTFVGLVLFLTGVNVGFIPVGHLIGFELADSTMKWILVPLGMIIGYFIVAAEPAVIVLNKQVEDVSGGAIPQKAMKRGLSIGMAVALALSMIRILTEIPIMWILIPGYAIALILTFFVPKIFTGIAFDSGGVCSGPLTSTFLLPFAMGVCDGVGGNIMTEAFGIVSMVAMTPLIAIQIMGLVYSKKMKTVAIHEIDLIKPIEGENEVIEYNE